MNENLNTNPPKWSLRILKFFIRKEYLEEIEGDMEEIYKENLATYSKKMADRKYTIETFKLVRQKLIKNIAGTQKINFYGMFSFYFTVGFRNIIKHRTYSAINILGLATSMAISMLIILFLMDQDRMDEHNPNAENIYRVTTGFFEDSKDRIVSYGTSPFEIKEIVELNMGDITDASQLTKESGTIRFEENTYGFQGLYVSPNFFEFFNYSLIKGEKKNALKNAHSVVLSKELADKLFKQQDPIGQLVSINNMGTFTVSGVVESKSVKSHFRFELLLSSKAFTEDQANKYALNGWEVETQRFYNYFQLKKDASPNVLIGFLSDIDHKFSEDKKALYSFDIQRLDQINLGWPVRNELGNTSPIFVGYFFIVLALVLILSSSFNFVNLSIARGLRRVKEVGVRKIVGATKTQIIIQFLIEAQLIMFLSLFFAFLLLQLLVPMFNDLKLLRDIDGAITMNFNTNLSVYASFFAFSFTVGLFSGIYPALYLASFNSLLAIKESRSNKTSATFIFRKILVFFQYVFSIIFIITTIILYQQSEIIINTNYGFSHSNLMNIAMPNVSYATLRSELLKRSEIEGVSAISDLPVLSTFKNVQIINKEVGNENIKSSNLSIDPYTIDNLNLKLLAGRNFIPDLKSDLIESVIINEKALKAIGYSRPEEALNVMIDVIKEGDQGQRIEKCKVIGVVKDFSYEIVFKESGPLIMNYNPDQLSIVNIRYKSGNKTGVAAAAESVWKQFDNVQPFEYEHYDYNISDINDEFIDIVRIVGLISLIAIIIAGLGQFSMVVHHVQLKVKEIGIRKVLGANLSKLMLLLSRDFLVIILLAIMVATPVSWKINTFWTNKTFQSPEVSIFNLSLGVLIVLLLAIGTIYFLVRKAVNANPVDSLKYE